MKILFCNIAYMNNYIGNIEKDIPKNGGSWVSKNKDAHEQWNFLNFNGYCKGFVQNKGNFSIERIDKTCSKSDEVKGVTVVWCALKGNGETVIVGWYENATVYRQYFSEIYTPIIGMDRFYFCEAKAEDCYLLPEDLRDFKIGRSSIDGQGKGFGQQNFWYAESAYAREILIPKVEAYIEKNRSNRINRIKSDFAPPVNATEPLSEEEKELSEQLYKDEEDYEYLPYAYRNFFSDPTANNAFFVAQTLRLLYQIDDSIGWYLKTIELEGEKWDTLSVLAYLYQHRGEYDESTKTAIKLLEFKEAENQDVRDEIYSILADNFNYKDQVLEAIKWLDKIISESKNESLLEHTKKVKKQWSEFI